MIERVCRYSASTFARTKPPLKTARFTDAACVETHGSPASMSGLRWAMASFGAHHAIRRGHVAGR